jgi:glycosyltransferase involved in cell wall biosynthesis
VSRYLLYDFLQVAGGAERLMLELAHGMPDHRLVVSRVFPEARALEALGGVDVRALGTPLTRPLGPIFEAIHAFRHRTAFLEDAQSVIYSGFYAPFAVHRQRGGRRILYCHTPPRFAYDLRDFFLARYPAPVRPLATAFFDYVKRHYEEAISRMDTIVANSENVRGRLKRFCGVESVVVNPPIDTAGMRWIEAGDYYVSLARLAPYKRVDLVIRAFLAMPEQRLVVASGGPEERRLRALAAGATNISFTGWTGDGEFRDLVGRARAAIYVPQDEDFGMSPVEAMAAGKPVIGVAEGGVLETVVDGETGILLPPSPSVEAVVDAVRRLDGSTALAMRSACESRAARYAAPAFLARMREVVGENAR